MFASVYESELAREPGLHGRIVLQFVIAPSGGVLQSAVQSSTVSNQAVGHCIASAIRRWLFPQPSAGIVIGTYPLKLDPTTRASWGR